MTKLVILRLIADQIALLIGIIGCMILLSALLFINFVSFRDNLNHLRVSFSSCDDIFMLFISSEEICTLFFVNSIVSDQVISSIGFIIKVFQAHLFLVSRV